MLYNPNCWCLLLSGTLKNSNENLTVSESHSQPSFASQFLEKLQSKVKMLSLLKELIFLVLLVKAFSLSFLQADSASYKNLSDISLNKCRSSREVECPVHERRQSIRILSQPAGIPSRDSPFLCASTFANKDEQRCSNGDLKAFESFSTSHSGKNLSSLSARKWVFGFQLLFDFSLNAFFHCPYKLILFDSWYNNQVYLGL